MFEVKKSDFEAKLVLPGTASANPCDNDGTLTNSEPHIQRCILDTVANGFSEGRLTDEHTALVRSTFGQGDGKMSRDLYFRLREDPVLGKNEVIARLTEHTFVPFFIDARRAVWEAWTSSGVIKPKPFALEYLNEFRESRRIMSLVTGMPLELANASVRHVLQADDILPRTRERRVCCDDPRMNGSSKPDPLCYDIAVAHLVERFDIAPNDMWVIEDRANGAVAALRAEYTGENRTHQGAKIGKVVIIPDEEGDGPLELWDAKAVMSTHLAANPDDRGRIVFLRSLEDLTFAR